MVRRVTSFKSRHDLFFLLLSLGGMAAYVLHAWGNIHGQVSVIDEGLYLYKGLLYVQGRYMPFQDYGPLTNHMPLSFLIPGWLQVVFGPGIRTGRLAALALGVLLLIGLWLLTRRLAGIGWASMAVWGVVLNPALVKIYSQALSQVLVACMLIWVLFLAIGVGRRQAKLTAASLLAAALAMTRINIFPVWILLLFYLYWQHGRRAALLASSTGLLVLVVGHAVYWPEILKLWAKWIPEAISPFLQDFRPPEGLIPAWNPQMGRGARFDSFLSSAQMHMLPLFGWLLFLFATATRMTQLERWKVRAGLFIAALFLVLYGTHAWASLGLNYCVFCLKNYLAFFSPLGLVLFAMAAQQVMRTDRRPLQAAALGIAVGFPFLLGLPTGERLTARLLATALPRVSGSTLQPGTSPVGVMLSNKLGMAPDVLQKAGASVLAATVVILLLALIAAAWRRAQSGGSRDSGLRAVTVLGLAVLLGIGSVSFGNNYVNYDCGQDQIAAVEAVGKQLKAAIPAGSQIYWGVGQSPVPLLYLEDVEIYPQQLNGDYSFWYGGETQHLLQFGLWNEVAAAGWLDQADFFLSHSRSYERTLLDMGDTNLWELVLATSPTNPCRVESSILVFRSVQ